MSTRKFHILRPVWWLCLGLALPAASGWAAPVKVTTWNLETSSGAEKAEESRIPEAAAVLSKLNPEVIILQNVRDWQMCGQLAQALKPAVYNVLVCSSFRDTKTGASSKKQVAILAKGKAYFSWSEPWKSEEATAGGFAFAALQMGKERVGIFSIQLSDGAREASIRQVLAQVDSVKHWENNQVRSFVVAGAFDTSSENPLAAQDRTFSRLEEAGLTSALLELPPERRITRAGKAGQPGVTADCFFGEPAGAVGNPQILVSEGSEHYPVTCDLELDPAGQVAVRAERPPPKAQAAPVHTNEVKAQAAVTQAVPPVAAAPVAQLVPRAKPVPVVPTAQFGAEADRVWWWSGLAVGAVALAAMVWILLGRRRRVVSRTPTLIAMSAESGGGVSSADGGRIVVMPRSVTGSAADDAGSVPTARPIIHIETPGVTQSQSDEWKRRALAAEQKAEQATAIVRKGLMPQLSQWLKQKMVRKLISDRAELLETQQAATLRALEVDERLARIEAQIQQQNAAYEGRIDELTRELISAKEENRELIRAKIAQVKAEMEAARVRAMQKPKVQT